MEENRIKCLQLDIVIEQLVKQFINKYYTYEDWSKSEADCIDWEEDSLSYNWNIGDEYWSIDDMYTALYYDIPSKILFKWYDIRLEDWLKRAKGEKTDWLPLNLKNYYKACLNIKKTKEW